MSELSKSFGTFHADTNSELWFYQNYTNFALIHDHIQLATLALCFPLQNRPLVP